MASRIYLGLLNPIQEKMNDLSWYTELGIFRGIGSMVIIARGNRIEGIEAQE